MYFPENRNSDTGERHGGVGGAKNNGEEGSPSNSCFSGLEKNWLGIGGELKTADEIIQDEYKTEHLNRFRGNFYLHQKVWG